MAPDLPFALRSAIDHSYLPLFLSASSASNRWSLVDLGNAFLSVRYAALAIEEVRRQAVQMENTLSRLILTCAKITVGEAILSILPRFLDQLLRINSDATHLRHNCDNSSAICCGTCPRKLTVRPPFVSSDAISAAPRQLSFLNCRLPSSPPPSLSPACPHDGPPFQCFLFLYSPHFLLLPPANKVEISMPRSPLRGISPPPRRLLKL